MSERGQKTFSIINLQCFALPSSFGHLFGRYTFSILLKFAVSLRNFLTLIDETNEAFNAAKGCLRREKNGLKSSEKARRDGTQLCLFKINRRALKVH
jgi:hypothetical protein